MGKRIEEMAKTSNSIFIEVKPVKLRQEITLDVYELIEQERKETAKEILSWAERIAKPTYYNVDDNPRKGDLVLLSDIYKFFKEKYGVEVE